MKVLLSCCTSYYYFSIKMALAWAHYKHKLILHYCIKKMLVVIAFTWQVHTEFLSFYKDALHGKTGQKSPRQNRHPHSQLSILYDTHHNFDCIAGMPDQAICYLILWKWQYPPSSKHTFSIKKSKLPPGITKYKPILHQ